VFHVGHVMVDNVLYQAAKLDGGPAADFPSAALKQRLGAYGIVTLHRASNVDDAAVLAGIARALRELSQTLPLIVPVHPRTRKTLESFGLDLGPGVFLTEPLGYMEFLNLWRGAKVVLTDSGGLQEETTALGVPCLTLRENTERPVTVEEGTNTVVGTEPARILAAAQEILAGRTKAGRRPALWDGHAAVRIVKELERLLA
jgi:UDP-N-acetylglucosamine 2-epimerase (non-hydrolysing)